MTLEEMHKLKYKYNADGKKRFRIERAIHLHDEDAWNEYALTYNGIIVGSELVDVQFVENLIKEIEGR